MNWKTIKEYVKSKITGKQKINSESGELANIIKIENTPFTSIRIEDRHFLALGKYRLTEGMKTHKEVIKDAKRADWERVMQIMQIMIDENRNKLVNNSINEIQHKSITKQ